MMTPVADIGARIELLSMDARFHEITLALYRRDGDEGPVGIVHTYSPRQGAEQRTAFVARAMAVLGGLTTPPADGAWVQFGCGGWHERALRRLFLEACKVDPAEQLAPLPLEVIDRKTGQRIRVEPCGDGAYRVHADGGNADAPSRAPAVARGLAKLGDLEPADGPTEVRFPCGASHDELVALLLPRALNVRAATREDEERVSRGVLAAPGGPTDG